MNILSSQLLHKIGAVVLAVALMVPGMASATNQDSCNEQFEITRNAVVDFNDNRVLIDVNFGTYNGHRITVDAKDGYQTIKVEVDFFFDGQDGNSDDDAVQWVQIATGDLSLFDPPEGGKINKYRVTVKKVCKVDICHATASEQHPWEDIEVNSNAVDTHLSHGDFLIDEDHPCPPVPPNVPPVADDQDVEVQKNTSESITVTAIDSDNGPDPLTWEIVSDPLHGDLSGDLPNVTYTPNLNFTGEDSFLFKVFDGEDYSNNGRVDIEVVPDPHCPNGNIVGDQCIPDNPNPIPPPQCVIVSDTNDFYVEGAANAVLTSFVHPAWADALTPPAFWIWGDALVENPSVDETQTFTKTFYLENAPASATLQFAADNGALIKINGATTTDQLATLDDLDQNYDEPVESANVTSNLIAGLNTIEVTVKNLAYPTENPETNPAGLIYKLTANGTNCGEPEPEIENSCIDPSAAGAPEAAIPVGDAPGDEDELQEILNAEYGVNAPNALTEQDNYQEWGGTGNTVHFTVKNLSEDANSAHNHVFGYYLNGSSTFTAVFSEGTVGIPHDMAPNLAFGDDMTFSVAGVNTLVFAIADWDGSTFAYWATDRDSNAEVDQAVVYNIDDDEYAIAFEDLPLAQSDADYNDVVVSLHVEDCVEGAECEPGEELLQNGTFEVPEVGGAFWDIFNINDDPNLAWAAAWINPVGAPAVANVELQETGLSGGWLATSTGDQWTELDSDWNGHNPGPNGEAGQVAISQTIDTVAGEIYTVSFDFSPRPGTAAEQNSLEVLVDGNVEYTVPGTPGGANTIWVHHSFSFEALDAQAEVTFRDAGTPNDSLGTFVDNASVMCEEPEPTATLVATKIVCTDESELPNYGAEGPHITASTAEDWVNSHETCHLESDWQFQWVTDADSNINPGDNILTPASPPWSIFGPTAGDGTITTEIPSGGKVWVREILQDGYLLFSGANTEEDVSAEIYCSTDVLNYDNWDWIDPVEEGETYYCVAWNHPTEGQCNPEASNVLLSSDDDGEELLTQDESGPASLVSDPHDNWTDELLPALWIWKDTATSPEDAANETVETFTRTFDITGIPHDSTLTLAVDNSYVVSVNGTEVCSDDGEHNYESAVVCPVPASVLVNGENEITFTVTNMDHESANDPSNNPAGLVYKLVVNENECEIPDPIDVCSNIEGNQETVPEGHTESLGICTPDAPQCVPGAKWADEVVAVEQGLRKDGSVVLPDRSDPTDVLWANDGPAAGSFFSLGVGGTITVEFETYIANDAGDDLTVYEVTNGAYPLETALVEVSQNGSDWETLTEQVTNVGGITNLDIDETSFSWIRYVRLTDTSDVNLHINNHDGIDIDAIKGINGVCEAPGDEEEGEEPAPEIFSFNTGGGGGGPVQTYTPGDGNDDEEGDVAGASTCEPLLTQYLRMGLPNDIDEVQKLQNFLNLHLGLALALDGIFGQNVHNAVEQLQILHWQEILKPWIGIPGSGITGGDTPTGYVYKTTKWWINNEWCPGSEPFPQTLD